MRIMAKDKKITLIDAETNISYEIIVNEEDVEKVSRGKNKVFLILVLIMYIILVLMCREINKDNCCRYGMCTNFTFTSKKICSTGINTKTNNRYSFSLSYISDFIKNLEIT